MTPKTYTVKEKIDKLKFIKNFKLLYFNGQKVEKTEMPIS